MTKALFTNADYRMKSTHIYLLFFIFLILSSEITTVRSQSTTTSNNDQYSYGSFSPSVAVIIVVLIASIFFIVFFSIYLRHCSDDSSTVRQALSMRARRAVAAARGLDASVIATFPTLSYSEVKDHKMGKDALECAVCLNEFEEDETLRLIPKCDHVFHPECIDMWLESHVTCPVCRANLAPQTGDDDPVREDPGQSNNEEVVIQVDGNNDENRNLGLEPRSWSIRRPVKFRSHSTGHSLVQPGENLDRFTLRLPADMRKEVLSRVTSSSTSLPREGSSRKGYRTGAGELQGRFYRRIEIPDRGVKSDRWGIFTRGLSMRLRSPKVAVDGGEASTPKRRGNRTPPSKLPSFKCLEPKANDGDETRLFSDDSAGQSQV
ncbi:hypothetical protein DH2020_028275 [Rehmannia glutinosa]|uniref:RING-type E3 ubiquitin transferase n=1 Tax=Rehmannia glutinosa TaxID=99300 RepID=A0ABR0VSU8_REHGL